MTIVWRVAVLAVVSFASAASAQSLGDIARQEEARRAAVKAAARTKVLTNANLVADPNAGATPPAPSTVTAPPSAPAVAASTTARPGNDSAASVPAAAPPEAKPKEDEALWRRLAAQHRDRLAKAKQRVDGFSGAPKDDPREQVRIDALIKKAQDELRRADEAQRLFVMQADVAGVPMAWIK